MPNYIPCAGTGQPAAAPRVFRNESGSAKFARNKGKVYGTCPECGRTGLVVRSMRETAAPAHKDQRADALRYHGE